MQCSKLSRLSLHLGRHSSLQLDTLRCKRIRGRPDPLSTLQSILSLPPASWCSSSRCQSIILSLVKHQYGFCCGGSLRQGGGQLALGEAQCLFHPGPQPGRCTVATAFDRACRRRHRPAAAGEAAAAFGVLRQRRTAAGAVHGAARACACDSTGGASAHCPTGV